MTSKAVGLVSLAAVFLLGANSCDLYKRVDALEQHNKELHWKIRHLQKLTDRLAVKTLSSAEHQQVWKDIQLEQGSR